MNEVDKLIERYSGLTEEYSFYNGNIILRYDVKNHVYLLTHDDGTLEEIPGVTSTVHIIDKSHVLLPWGCKMMAQKIINLSEFYKSNDSYQFNASVFEDIISKSKSAHKDKLEEAGDIGHVAHAWIENYIKHELDSNIPLIDFPEEPRAYSCCKAALNWIRRHNVQFISTERKIYSRKHKYAGTMDGLAYVDSCDDPLCCPNPFTRRLSIIDWKTSNYLYPEYLMQTASYEAAYEEETGEEVEDRWVIRLGKEDAKFESWHIEEEHFKEDFGAFLAALDLRIKFDALEERLSDIKDIYRKGKKQKKLDNLAIACKNSNKYKGIRYPTCNNGNPCKTCLEKYEARQVEKAAKQIKAGKPKKVKLTHEQIVKNLQGLLKST